MAKELQPNCRSEKCRVLGKRQEEKQMFLILNLLDLVTTSALTPLSLYIELILND